MKLRRVKHSHDAAAPARRARALQRAKARALIAITQQLIAHSTPTAEDIVRASIALGCVHV